MRQQESYRAVVSTYYTCAWSGWQVCKSHHIRIQHRLTYMSAPQWLEACCVSHGCELTGLPLQAAPTLVAIHPATALAAQNDNACSSSGWLDHHDCDTPAAAAGFRPRLPSLP